MKITIECSEKEISCIINDLICIKPKSDNLVAADTEPTHGVLEKDRELLRKELECLSNESLFMGGNKDVLADYALAMCELYRTLNLNGSSNNQTPTAQSGRTFGDLKKDFQRLFESYCTPCRKEESQIPPKSILSDNPNLYEAIQQFIQQIETDSD